MLARIGRKAGVPDLLASLARLPGPDVRSLMLHLARAQSARRSPAQLLQQHADDRTVPAGHVDGRRVHEFECRAGDRRAFELAALREQVAVYLRLLAEVAPGHATAVAVSDASAPPSALQRDLVEPLRDEFPKTQIALRPERVDGAAYYRGLMVDIGLADPGGAIHSVADGGATDWTARLLSDRKERMVVTGIGVERVIRVAESD